MVEKFVNMIKFVRGAKSAEEVIFVNIITIVLNAKNVEV
jgi:hypothetical protein